MPASWCGSAAVIEPGRATDLALALMDGPFVWGRADCCTAACDVFLALHGVDPMAPLRGRYRTRAGALRLIAARGGWRAMARALAAEAGLVAGQGGAGEIGLAVVGGSHALVIGIERGLWAGKGADGVVAVRGVEVSWSRC
jgi:hypothetical protein